MGFGIAPAHAAPAIVSDGREENGSSSGDNPGWWRLWAPYAIDPGLSSRTGCFLRAHGDLAHSCKETHEVRGQRRTHAERLHGSGMANGDLRGEPRLEQQVGEAGDPSAAHSA